MDVDRMLNLERRTGVKDTDISDFERKVNDVEKAIKGMMDGTIKPEDVRVEGIESEEEKLQKQMAREARLKVQQEKERQLREQRKKEEYERWWAGVEIFKPQASTESSSVVRQISDEEQDKKSAVLNRYTADYSRWNEWKPTDEASVAELEEAKQKEEEVKNKEFERNNAEFCDQFLTDMEQRKKQTEKKRESADISRLKGNRYFKAKAYERALECYMDALKESPFEAKTVNNIAQVYIKTKEYDDALEFLKRTLYLESGNIKALSRQALVLGEQGKTSEAVAVMKTALALEPQNAELLAQEKELKIIEAERRAEEAAATTFAGRASAPAATTAASSSQALSPVAVSAVKVAPVTAQTGASLVDQVMISLRALLASDASAGAQVVVQEPALNKAIEGDESLRIYARTSGTTEALIGAVKLLSVTPTGDSAAPLASCLRLLATAVDGQRASKLLLIDLKVISTLKALLQEVLMSDLQVVDAALRVLHVACKDDISVKCRAAVISDKALFLQAATLLGNICFQASSNGTVVKGNELNVLRLCAEIVKIAAFSEQGNTTLASLDPVAGASLACGLASALYTVNTSEVELLSPYKTVAAQKLDLLELFVEASLGLSQIEALREHFALEVPMAENKLNKSKYSASLCGSLIATMRSHEVLSTNGMAALMNACLEPRNVVRQAIIAGGGLKIAMSDLALTDAQRASKEGVTLLRKAGLLARLAADESTHSTLMEAEHYRMICRRISIPAAAASPASPPAQWLVDERSHFIRVLANLTKPTAACMTIGMQESLLAGLLAVFPTPREDCGEITATSVTLMPADLVPAMLLGNAARCLMPYADDTKYAAELYSNKQLKGVEKMICAMASCPDMRVRKNIAILLAKGCRVAGVREKMTALRGMQMMVELQSQL